MSLHALGWVLAQTVSVEADPTGTPFSGVAQQLVNGIYYLVLLGMVVFAAIGIGKGVVGRRGGFADAAAGGWMMAAAAIVGFIALIGLNSIFGWAEGLGGAVG